MSKKWVTMCLAGCFGVMLGIGGMNSSSAYAAEGKKLAMEGAVFDLKASSSLMVYGNVSDKARHPVSDATVAMKAKGQSEEYQTDSYGGYAFYVTPGTIYSLSASKSNLGKTKSVKLNITKNDDSHHIVNLQFRKAEK